MKHALEEGCRWRYILHLFATMNESSRVEQPLAILFDQDQLEKPALFFAGFGRLKVQVALQNRLETQLVAQHFDDVVLVENHIAQFQTANELPSGREIIFL